MAFETVVNNHMTKGRVPFIRMKWTLSGNVRGYISKEVVLDAGRFYFELDKETKQIRVKSAPDGKRGDSISTGGSGRNFALSKVAMREIDTEERIFLEPGDDGWWYGSYDNDK